MTYRSYFDQIEEQRRNEGISGFSAAIEFLRYHGTLEEVLTQTEDALRKGEGALRTFDLVRLALHPPRILRAIIDYKIEHPGTEIEEITREAMFFCLQVYRRGEHCLDSLSTLKQKILSFSDSSQGDSPITRPINQKLDSTSSASYYPNYSKDAVRRIAQATHTSNLLFIALAHGGIPVGLDVFLRFSDEFPESSSVFYAARHSRDKHKDQEVQLSPSEIDYLRNLASTRKLVIFDEDRSTGATLGYSVNFFEQKLGIPHDFIIDIANIG